MRIQHNVMAMNAYRNYNQNTSALAKNLEKLSSGYKINRAGDDAAGLAISEKMRAQITGLQAAQKNVKDGVSLVKTAEGAMQEIQDMLNRMDYLATQSANGTYDDPVDRKNLQKEVDALRSEINRIADSANFNGIKLLDGSLAKTGTASTSSSSSAQMVATVESTFASLKTNVDGDSAVAGKYQATIAAAIDTNNAGVKPATTDVLKFEITYADANGETKTKTIYSEALAGTETGAAAFASLIKNAVNADEDLKKLFTVSVGTSAGKDDMELTFTANEAGTNGAQLKGVKVIGFFKNADRDDDKVDTASTPAASAGTGVFSSGTGEQAVKVVAAGADKTKVDVIDVGTNAIAANDTIKIGDKTYEFVTTNGDLTAVGKGNIAVNLGADSTESVKNLVEMLKETGVTSAKLDTANGELRIRIGNLDEIKAAEEKVKISTTNTNKGIVIAPNEAERDKSQFTVLAGSGKKDVLFDISYINDKGETKKISLSYNSDTVVSSNASNIVNALKANDELNDLFNITTAAGNAGSVTISLEAKNKGVGEGTILSVGTQDTDTGTVRDLTKIKEGRDKGQTISLDVNKISDGDTLTIDGKTFQFVDKDNLDSIKDGNIAVILDKSSQAVTSANLNLALKQNGMDDVEFNGSTNSFYIANGKTSIGSSSGGLTLQIGDTADKFNQLTVSVGDMHTKAMGTGKTTLDGKEIEVTKTIADIDISSLEGAQDAIAVVKNAINYVSEIRGDLGAVQNRLEHTQKNLSVMEENIQDAESNIRDTDVAAEMMAYTKNNILIQSAQAMLAQANAVPQGVLQLLG